MNITLIERGLGFLGLLVLAAGIAVIGAETTRADTPPNIVYVLADDLGWAELGCYGNTFNETPNLDRLARQGVKFTQAYSAAPVCSPYRASLLSGQWPARVGITDYLRPSDPQHLPLQIVTLAEALRQAGYATGMVGKWHLTGYRAHGVEEIGPAEQGFDEVMVTESRGIGSGDYWFPYRFAPEVKNMLGEGEYLVDRVNAEAVRFIERHRAGPFFLYVSHYAVHTALDGKPALVEHFAAKPGAGKGPAAGRNNPHLAAQLKSIDEGLGMILDKLDELGLAEKTVVVFTSDNGGQASVTENGALRAGKSTLYEGGIRIPFLLRYPPLVPRGATSDAVITSPDLYPTLIELARAKLPAGQPLDGVSIVPALADPKAAPDREAIYWYYPLKQPHFLGGRSAGAIRAGDWKMIEFFDTGQAELYNLAADLAEEHNLAEEQPAKLAELRRQYGAWLAGLGLTRPKPPKVVEVELFGRRFRLRDQDTVAMREGEAWPRRFSGKGWLELPRAEAPQVARRGMQISATVEGQGNGVIVAHGGDGRGYALYLDGSRPAFATTVAFTRTTVVAANPLPTGKVKLEAQLERDGTMTLKVNGQTVARGKAPGPIDREPGDSLEIGADTISPVGLYETPNPLRGVIHALMLDDAGR